LDLKVGDYPEKDEFDMDDDMIWFRIQIWFVFDKFNTFNLLIKIFKINQLI
jgi:hypothetical protein